MSKFKVMLAAAAAMNPAILNPLLKPWPPKVFTHVDEERIAKAEAKRQRKAAKRAASKESGNGQ
jgi:hypothetical protein